MHVFYSPDIERDLFLNEEESHHCAKVLRCREGEQILVLDGKGHFFTCSILVVNARKVLLRIDKTVFFEKADFEVTIAIAPTKNIERFEWFLEKATEIGVSRVIPILCDNSERKVIKLDRLERVVVAATKQSMHAYMPVLDDLTPFKKLLTMPFDGGRFIAHCYDMPKQEFFVLAKPKQAIMVLIGPEGDFSESEVDLAMKNGFSGVSLGTSRLRTETAGLVACHTVTLLNCKA